MYEYIGDLMEKSLYWEAEQVSVDLLNVLDAGATPIVTTLRDRILESSGLSPEELLYTVHLRDSHSPLIKIIVVTAERRCKNE